LDALKVSATFFFAVREEVEVGVDQRERVLAREDASAAVAGARISDSAVVRHCRKASVR